MKCKTDLFVGMGIGIIFGIILIILINLNSEIPQRPAIDYRQKWGEANIQLMIAEDIINIQRAELNEIKLNQILADTTTDREIK